MDRDRTWIFCYGVQLYFFSPGISYEKTIRSRNIFMHITSRKYSHVSWWLVFIRHQSISFRITWLALGKACDGPWWRHQMEAFSELLALCAGNSPVAGEFPSQRPVTRSFDVFFDLRLSKRHRAHYDVIVMPNASKASLKNTGQYKHMHLSIHHKTTTQ